MDSQELYDRLDAAIQGTSDDAAVTFTATYAPAGGADARLFPPTYPLEAADPQSKRTPYVIESRLVDREPKRTVLLDSVQSQANRLEEEIDDATRRGLLALGRFEISHTLSNGRTIRLGSFQFPHRVADAYLRDAKLDGTAFDRSPVGQRLRTATAEDVTPIYEREPLSLLLGFWDSHRKGRQLKLARSYHSEMFGLEPEVGHRAAGRMDPNNLIGGVKDAAKAAEAGAEWQFQVPESGRAGKGERLSEIGHGNIAPQSAHGGVTVRDVRRIAVLSTPGLARLRFGAADPKAADAARVALAALGLLGDRLAFAKAALWLRSGCELTLVSDRVAFQQRGGALDEIDVSVRLLVDLVEQARRRAAADGLTMAEDVVTLEPGTQLARALEYAYLQASTTEE